MMRPNTRKDQSKDPLKQSEFEERMIQVKRVSKKTKGGNTIKFASLVVIGDKNGRVGAGYGKGRDVQSGIHKAVAQAKRSLVKVPLIEGSIPHEVCRSYGSAEVLLKPAPKGAGLIAGGAVRVVLELAGIRDISGKMLGSSNKICNIRAALKALSALKQVK